MFHLQRNPPFYELIQTSPNRKHSIIAPFELGAAGCNANGRCVGATMNSSNGRIFYSWFHRVAIPKESHIQPSRWYYGTNFSRPLHSLLAPSVVTILAGRGTHVPLGKRVCGTSSLSLILHHTPSLCLSWNDCDTPWGWLPPSPPPPLRFPRCCYLIWSE